MTIPSHLQDIATYLTDPQWNNFQMPLVIVQIEHQISMYYQNKLIEGISEKVKRTNF